MSNRSKSNCATCPVRDICPIEFDGNEEPSARQLKALSYVMFQLNTIGVVVEAPRKDAGQTPAWTVNKPPLGTVEEARSMERTIEQIERGEEVRAQPAFDGSVRPNHPGVSTIQ